jgi:hypothetical protein
LTELNAPVGIILVDRMKYLLGYLTQTRPKWKGDRRNLQNGKAIGEIFKMRRR